MRAGRTRNRGRPVTEIIPAPLRRMLRYEVGIDGRVSHELTGDPVHVGALACGAGVEFWAEHDEGQPVRRRTFQVVGTGHPVPPGAQWAGTAPRTPEGLVWHLYEIRDPGPPRFPALIDLWKQSGGDRERYAGLLRQHGHVLAPGDAGYDPDASRTLPCGEVPGG